MQCRVMRFLKWLMNRAFQKGHWKMPKRSLVSGRRKLTIHGIGSWIRQSRIKARTQQCRLYRNCGDEPVDIITFGSPCTDISVAGKRQGLNAPRSGLFFQAVRIIKEMRCATNGKYPRFAVWENVAGAFFSPPENPSLTKR